MPENMLRAIEVIRELRQLRKKQQEIDAVLPELVWEAFSLRLGVETIMEVTGIKRTRLYRLRDIGMLRPTVVDPARGVPLDRDATDLQRDT